MSIFCSKKLPESQRICLRLQKARTERGLSLDQIATITHIAKKYLQAIDECNFCLLPKARAYRVAYIKEYALAIGLDPKEIAQQLAEEDGLKDIEVQHPYRSIHFFPFSSVAILARSTVIGLVIIAFVGYLAMQVRGVIEPPKLVVYTPAEGYIASGINILVQGETQSECKLTINGQEVMANDQGKFESALDLATGVNTITISAIKKHGKTTTITRHVIVKDSRNQPLTLR